MPKKTGGGGKEKVNFRMPEWMVKAIKEIAIDTKEDETTVIVEILRKRLNRMGYTSELLNKLSDDGQEKKAQNNEELLIKTTARVAGE